MNASGSRATGSLARLMAPCMPFFFSSRRRHTRCLSDWSSDVCSSDLEQGTILGAAQAFAALGRSFGPLAAGLAYDGLGQRSTFLLAGGVMLLGGLVALWLPRSQEERVRSEERRVGKEWRCELGADR